jgi:hypothetical protein
MAKRKNDKPPKSKAQAIREAIGILQSEGRDITTAAILSLLPSLGINNAKANDISNSAPWKELREKEKSDKSGTSRRTPTSEAGAASPAPTTPGITKTEAVGQAFKKLGGDAKPKTVIEYVKKTYGLDVSPRTVSNFKALQAKQTAVTGTPPSRPPEVEAVVVAVVAPGDNFSHEEIAYGAFCISQEEKRLQRNTTQEQHWQMAIERLRKMRGC